MLMIRHITDKVNITLKWRKYNNFFHAIINKEKYELFKIQPAFKLLHSQQEWDQNVLQNKNESKGTSWNMKGNFMASYYHNCKFSEGVSFE